jgi:hypothetical protein
VVTQPIGLVHYPGVAEGLYAASSSGTAVLLIQLRIGDCAQILSDHITLNCMVCIGQNLLR